MWLNVDGTPRLRNRLKQSRLVAVRATMVGRLPCELVIARYNEDILWSRNFSKCTLTTVYNKGKAHPKGLHETARSVQLPNVGREAHTFLHHIVRHYDHLATTTIFFQGAINTRVEQRLGPPERYMRNGVDRFYGNNVRAMGRRNGYGWHLHSDSVRASGHTLGSFFANVLHRNLSQSSPWVPGAYFSVGRNAVHRNSRRYYQRIMQNTNLSVHSAPEEAHFMERAWMSIFFANSHARTRRPTSGAPSSHTRFWRRVERRFLERR